VPRPVALRAKFSPKVSGTPPAIAGAAVVPTLVVRCRLPFT
jgi:hypothetical protein